LNIAFTTIPILTHPDFSSLFFLETNASDFVLGAILSQIGEDRKLHPIAFHSRKFSATNINYKFTTKNC